jgi:hypothetical protein
MTWKTIRNYGKVNPYFKQRDTDKKTAEFLNETLSEFARVSTQLFDNIGEFAFDYKEKQLSSIFLPAFFNLGYGAIQEVPTRRKERGQASSHAWLDYWVQKDNDSVYLIELKHDRQFLNNNFADRSHQKLIDAAQQLTNIRAAQVRELSAVKNTHKVALLVLPVWRNISEIEDIEEDEEYFTETDELETTADNILDDISDEISWLGIWSLPEQMQFAFLPEGKTKFQSFAGVIFIATVIL